MGTHTKKKRRERQKVKLLEAQKTFSKHGHSEGRIGGGGGGVIFTNAGGRLFIIINQKCFLRYFWRHLILNLRGAMLGSAFQMGTAFFGL